MDWREVELEFHRVCKTVIGEAGIPYWTPPLIRVPYNGPLCPEAKVGNGETNRTRELEMREEICE